MESTGNAQYAGSPEPGRWSLSGLDYRHMAVSAWVVVPLGPFPSRCRCSPSRLP